MLRIASLLFFSLLTCSQVFSQTREELEKQRLQLKKEIEQTEKLLNSNKAQTKENLLQLKLISNKVNLQDRVIDNINKDLRILNNNMYTIQKDINRYDRLLDTLKLEYAKSMVYAYKNRSNYDFMNFIFSASNFNDAIKRISYLKSYREYREKQGENIKRTQELRKQKRVELSSTKENKNATLSVQSKEMAALEQQKQEKDRIVSELKKQGKQLNNEIASKQKQLKKVSNAISAAIAKAQAEAKRKALEEQRKKKEEEDRLARLAKANAPKTSETSAPAETKTVVAAPAKAPRKVPESILLNAGNIELNNKFEANRGSLPWPVDKGVVLMHFGLNHLESGTEVRTECVTISSEIGAPVKSVFNGVVSVVTVVEDMQVVILQHGKYFTTYSNLSGVTVRSGQEITTGQVLGKVASNIDGIGAIDFFMSNEKANFNPESWLRNR